MTTKEMRMYQNIKKWRSLPKSERRIKLHALNIQQVANSMAMEGEPVSNSWLQKNIR